MFGFFLGVLPKHAHAQALIPAPIESRGNINVQVKTLQSIHTNNKELLDELDTYNDFKKKLKLPEAKRIETFTSPRILCDIDKKMSAESYRFDILPEGSLKISGGEAGVFYGLMSLLQLESQQRGKKTISIPQLNDKPAFAWRGLHLDVSRHFFPVSFIKKYIDLLALHKMNTFHWHLTDDQGWRIEIKKYPELTRIGSKRKETCVGKYIDPYVGDNTPVAGFYTQEEIKDVVRYAAARHINVVPEIEMPGHALAALTAYPQYACEKSPKEVLTKWGVSDDVFCTNDSTLRFLKNILNEVFELFPSEYIHIGGDEVPKTRWKNCASCQRTLTKNKLKNEDELQSYFIRKIDAYISSKGRKTIGWDEILEGGLAPGAAVMSWRGVEGGIAAAKQKHNVVMSPGTHCYFDHYQGNVNIEPLAIGGYTPIEKVYDYNPIPSTLNADEAKYILGAQANVWTEYIPSTKQVEYMAYPRAAALSEVLWTGKQRPGFEDFKERLRTHFNFLDTLNVHYAPAIFQVQATHEINNDKVQVNLFTHYKQGDIYYQLIEPDGTVGEKTVYQNGESIVLDKSTIAQAYYQEPGQRRGPTFEQAYSVHKALGKEPQSKTPPSQYYNHGGLGTLVDGLRARAPRNNQQWLGWYQEDVQLTFDLGSEQLINQVTVSLLEEISSHIFLPEKLIIEIGSDGSDFTPVKTLDRDQIKSFYDASGYIRVPFDNTIFGKQVRISSFYDRTANKKPWIFISEVEVD
jgi:hexosaminidase